MPQFSYKARRRSGEIVQGVVEVADRSAALLQIERSGLFPVAVDAGHFGANFGEQIFHKLKYFHNVFSVSDVGVLRWEGVTIAPPISYPVH